MKSISITLRQCSAVKPPLTLRRRLRQMSGVEVSLIDIAVQTKILIDSPDKEPAEKLAYGTIFYLAWNSSTRIDVATFAR